jgi:hypothetical protein
MRERKRIKRSERKREKKKKKEREEMRNQRLNVRGYWANILVLKCYHLR